MPMQGGVGRFSGDRRGGVAVIAAVSGGLICALAAVAVDLGFLALHARKLQGAADLAAMAAASDLARADLAGRATAVDNIGTGVESLVVRGRYVADAAQRPADRFTPGEIEPNAVRVTLTHPAPIFFGRFILGRDRVRLTRSATAAAPDQTPRAMFSIGSRLAALDGGLANQLLSGLTGSTVSLNLMDYNALASADVNLLTWFDALAVDAKLQAGDYDALLAHDLDAGRALKVLEQVAGGDADSALSKLSHAALGVKVRLGQVVGVDAASARGVADALDAKVSVQDLVMALLETGGDRQVQLNLGAQAGLADVQAFVAIGERPNRSPWMTVSSRAEPVIRTAQTRVYLKARTAQKLSGLAQVDLPVLVELAASEARLKTIDCGAGPSVVIEARPGLASAMVGTIDEGRLNDFKRPLAPSPATLLSVLGIVRITAASKVEAADPGFTPLTFSGADIAAKRIRSVHATGLTQGIVASLVQRMQVDVHVLGLGLGLGDLARALGLLLTPVAPVLDGVLNTVLDLAGVRLGEADVVVHDVTCPGPGAASGGRPALVG